MMTKRLRISDFCFRIVCLSLSVFCFLIFLTKLSAYADGQAGTDIAVLNAAVGARPLGMGGAFTAVADNADSPFWNPAGLGFINDHEINSMQTKLSTDADHYYVSYVQPFLGGTLGISWVQLGTGNMALTSSEVDSNNEVVDLGISSYFSSVYMLAYGKELNDRVSLGLTAKYLTQDMAQVGGGQAYGYSLTPGILIKFPNHWRLGLKIDELINQQKWQTGAIEESPAKLRVGLAYVKSNPGLFSLDLCQTLRSGYSATAAVGYEWAKDGVSLRAGYNEDGVTLGAGFFASPAQIDYAYVTQGSLSRENTHRISLAGKW